MNVHCFIVNWTLTNKLEIVIKIYSKIIKIRLRAPCLPVFSTFTLCEGNSPVTGEFPSRRPVTRSFGVFFDLHPDKRLSKPSRRWWFEMQSCSFDVTVMCGNYLSRDWLFLARDTAFFLPRVLVYQNPYINHLYKWLHHTGMKKYMLINYDCITPK